MRTAQEVAKKIKEEADERQVSINKMLQECGLAKKVVDNMKTGSMPAADKLAKIAHYLGVSTDYLLTGKENNFKVITDERRYNMNGIILWGVEFARNFKEVLTVLDTENKGPGLDEISRICDIPIKLLKEWETENYHKWSKEPSEEQIDRILSRTALCIPLGNLDNFRYTYKKMKEEPKPMDVIQDEREMYLIDIYRKLDVKGKSAVDRFAEDEFKRVENAGDEAN